MYDWALNYLYDGESLNEIARRYGVSRPLVKSRLADFWATDDDLALMRGRAEELGIDTSDPEVWPQARMEDDAGLTSEETSAPPKASAHPPRHANGHGDALSMPLSERMLGGS